MQEKKKMILNRYMKKTKRVKSNNLFYLKLPSENPNDFQNKFLN